MSGTVTRAAGNASIALAAVALVLGGFALGWGARDTGAPRPAPATTTTSSSSTTTYPAVRCGDALTDLATAKKIGCLHGN